MQASKLTWQLPSDAVQSRHALQNLYQLCADTLLVKSDSWWDLFHLINTKYLLAACNILDLPQTVIYPIMSPSQFHLIQQQAQDTVLALEQAQLQSGHEQPQRTPVDQEQDHSDETNKMDVDQTSKQLVTLLELSSHCILSRQQWRHGQR